MKVGDIVIRRCEEKNPTAVRGSVVSLHEGLIGRLAGVVFGSDPSAVITAVRCKELIVLPPPQDAASQTISEVPTYPVHVTVGARVSWSEMDRKPFGGHGPDGWHSTRVTGTVAHIYGAELVLRRDKPFVIRDAHRYIATRLIDDVKLLPVKPHVYRIGSLLPACGAVELTNDVVNALAEKGLYP